MLSIPKKISTTLGILLAGVVFLFAGCDSAGPAAEKADDSLLKVTNDLSDRMTVYDNEEAAALSTANAMFTLKAVSQIDPPTSSQSASHLSASSGDVFVGYKVPGGPFGGGVDILDKNNPTNLTNEDNALRSSDLDVQEVVYESAAGSNNLFVAGAVDFGNIDARDYGNTPAVLLRAGIQNNGNVATVSGGNVEATEVAMPDRLTKSVALASGNDGGHSLYAVTDGDSFFEFDDELGSRAEHIKSGGVEFSSVTSFDSGKHALALADNGNVYYVDTDGAGAGNFTRQQNFPDTQDKGIARISSHNHSGTINEELAYVALNGVSGQPGGLAVLSKDGSEIRYRKSDEYYVSVTATDDRVFAAGPGGTIDVFAVTSGLSNTNTSQGLSLEGSFDLGGLQNIGAGGDIASAQVNQILATNNYLYVAASTEGTVVLEIAEDQGDIF